jgi:hypothetical protein
VHALRGLISLVLAVLVTGCADDSGRPGGDDSGRPVVVGRFVEAPNGGDRSGCEPTSESFTAEVNDGSFNTPDAAFLHGASEHNIPGPTVVAFDQRPDSALYYSYSAGDLRAISEAIQTGNDLWTMGGVRYCK